MNWIVLAYALTAGTPQPAEPTKAQTCSSIYQEYHELMAKVCDGKQKDLCDRGKQLRKRIELNCGEEQ